MKVIPRIISIFKSYLSKEKEKEMSYEEVKEYFESGKDYFSNLTEEQKKEFFKPNDFL